MQKDYRKSIATGLTRNARIDVVGDGRDGSVFVVIDGVAGRSSWEGKRIWDVDAGTGRWEQTIGQQGPRKGRIKLRPAGRESVDETVDAEFEIKWEPIFYTETVPCLTSARRSSPRDMKGKAKQLSWSMNVRLIMKVNGVQYERVIRTFPTINQACRCRPV